MKLLETSKIISLTLVSLAVGAPQLVTESESIDHEGRSASTLEDAVDMPAAADQHTQHRKRDAEIDLNEYVMTLIPKDLKKPADLPHGGSATIACLPWGDGAKSTMVNPDWLRKQTLNKIDYLLQPKEDLPDEPSSDWFTGDVGLDWEAWQTRAGYDDTVKENDWVDITFAWSSNSVMNELTARDVVKFGIDKCTEKRFSANVPRTIGFAAIVGSGTMYLWVGRDSNHDQNKDHLYNPEGREGLVWQTPHWVSNDKWDEFINDWGHGNNGKPVLMDEWTA